jgi:hypothetical protein
MLMTTHASIASQLSDEKSIFSSYNYFNRTILLQLEFWGEWIFKACSHREPRRETLFETLETPGKTRKKWDGGAAPYLLAEPLRASEGKRMLIGARLMT